VSVTPASANVSARSSKGFKASALDAFGNPSALPLTWSITPLSLGTVKPATGLTTTFTAAARGGSGTLTATVTGTAGPISGSASLTVTPGVVRVASIRYGIGKNAVLVTATVVDAGRRPVAGALVSALVRRNGHKYFTGKATTSANGRAIYRVRSSPGCYRTAVTKLVAGGFRWNRATPVNRFCK
jgi:hypothetical protein